MGYVADGRFPGMEADVMWRIETRVSVFAALAALGLVAHETSARAGEPDLAEARALATIERTGGYATPGVGIIPPAAVVTMGTGTTDDDLKSLADLPGLTVLTFEGTTVSDAGIAHLKGVKGLKVLSLEDTKVSDAGLAHLTGLPKLRSLDLTGTRITDAGVEHLVRMKGLREIIVEGTQITPEGVKTLRRSLRWCRIKSGRYRPRRSRASEATASRMISALDRLLPLRLDAEEDQGRADRAEQGDADQRADQRPAAARDRRAADDDRGDHLQLQPACRRWGRRRRTGRR